MQRKRRSSILVAVTVILILLLTGCDSQSMIDKAGELADEASPIKAGQTISDNSKWINSSIKGALDSDTPTNLKDDFYTAINKDWILSTDIPKAGVINFGNGCVDAVTSNQDTLIATAQSGSWDGTNGIGQDGAQLAHNQQILSQYVQLASNWDARNALGTDPAVPYLDAIKNISTMDDMTNYILDVDGSNVTGVSLVPFEVTQPLTSREVNTVMLTSDVPLSLGHSSFYKYGLKMNGIAFREQNNQAVKYLLKRMGYSDGEVYNILTGSYAFEGKLADAMSNQDHLSKKYIEKTDDTYTMDKIQEIQGDYPLTQILTVNGLDQSNSYTVCEPDYVKAVGKLYNTSNLEQMKDYYLVHTVIALLPNLDREAYDTYSNIGATDKKITVNKDDGGKGDGEDKKTDGADDTQTPEEKEREIILDGYVKPNLLPLFCDVYTAKYCTAEQKADLTSIIDKTISYYRTMISEEDWLSDETKAKAIEKLDAMTIRVLYPDSFDDYTALNLDGCTNMVQAMGSINAYDRQSMAAKVNTPVDLTKIMATEGMSTLDVNAFNMLTDNSINILAGIISDGTVYRIDMSNEEKYARIGTIIGHEISHGFDTTGAKFNKFGMEENWWTKDDEFKFSRKAERMSSFYGALSPYPGGTYTADVQTEAIADMGGVKSMLGLAEQIPDFNYDTFFQNYAQLWREKSNYSYVTRVAADTHPLSFMRTNVTLQQFDKFNEVYGLQEGDGMYLAPEERIIIW